MKYADCPTVSAEAVIRAPVDAIWALVTDLSTPARFSGEFKGAEWLEGAKPGMGARFVGHNQHPSIGEWDTISVVDVFDPPRAFGWAVGGTDDPAARWRFEMTETADGIRLTQHATLGPGPSGLTPAIEAMPDKEERIVARRLGEWEANMRATVEGIKRLAEQAP